jgi:6-phosphogluconate dehydrogenase
LNGNDIGIFGLAVMGRNLALNMADKGFAVAVFNRTASVTEAVAGSLESGQNLTAYYSVEEFVGSLKRPRRVMLMVQAGAPVDAVIGQVQPFLEAGDIVIDGGNSHFTDTERRAKALAEHGIHFLGVGISGGEFGARYGPSMMPGGPKEAYREVRSIFEAVAARADGSPCVAYLGTGGVGHYVKTVHNGIEYGVMQLISETYALMKELLGLSNERLADVYADWHRGDLNSYLLEITADIFRKRDEETDAYLVDMILAEAGQLGTGIWASQTALELHVPVPNIDIAVGMRSLSALAEERDGVRELLGQAIHDEHTYKSDLPVESVREALHAAVILTYIQGFALLQTASSVLGFGVNLRDVAAVWRAGCIIRSALLPQIMAIFASRPDLATLLLDKGFAERVVSRRPHLQATVQVGMTAGIPVPGLANALAYVDAYRADWWPFALIQAQRDYFGSHEYRRIDREGLFHTDWRPADEGEASPR